MLRLDSSKSNSKIKLLTDFKHGRLVGGSRAARGVNRSIESVSLVPELLLKMKLFKASSFFENWCENWWSRKGEHSFNSLFEKTKE